MEMILRLEPAAESPVDCAVMANVGGQTKQHGEI